MRHFIHRWFTFHRTIGRFDFKYRQCRWCPLRQLWDKDEKKWVTVI